MPEPRYANQLSGETSPYLLQHAHNPVHWFPWGQAALERAQREDLPILVSIGYAACHWCHVMAHESFEDAATAALLNAHFVCIKVDREERPDIDSIYMTAVQALTGGGGWPLNVFLLPDGTPFFGGTYFPPESKAAHYRTRSFTYVLQSIADAFQNRRHELVQAGAELLGHLQRIANTATAAAALQPALLDAAYATLRSSFDPREGGFGSAPKFPQPMSLEFLLRTHLRTRDPEPLRMLTLTLRKLALGGIYDQLGGGFHRYSVDERWCVPHFEKMLYDNAQLARLYVEAFQVTGEPFLRHIAEATLDYLARELRHPLGGFFSTQDADSLTPAGQLAEGAFFVWTPDQVREVLGEDTTLFCQLFDVTARGNFAGRTILTLPRSLEAVARVTGQPLSRIEAVVQSGRAKLFAAREQRTKPARDEKVLTAWNGMALRAFAVAAAALDRADYLEIAHRNADFLLSRLRRSDGRVMRSWKDDGPNSRAPHILGYLEDYALLGDGLLALYTTAGDPRWLRESIALAHAILDHFWDDTLGLFYDTAHDHERLIIRPRDAGDNATPSGTSVAVDLLLRLAALTGNEHFRACAERAIGGMGETLTQFALGFGRILCAADFALAQIHEVALVGDPASAAFHALRRVVQHTYRPHTVVAYLSPGDTESPALTPLVRDRPLLDGQATAYVCTGFACKLPVNDAEALKRQLELPPSAFTIQPS